MRFAGEIPGVQGEWYGVELDEAKGTSNGKLVGKQLFSCEEKHGVFLRGTNLTSEEEMKKKAAQAALPAQSTNVQGPKSTSMAPQVHTVQKGLHRVQRNSLSFPGPVQVKPLKGPAVISSFNPLMSKLDQCSERDFIELDGALNVVETFKIRGSQCNLSRNRKELDDYEEMLLAEAIPADHDGPQLAWPPTEESLATLIDHLKEHWSIPIHRSYFGKALVGARQLYSKNNRSLLDIRVDSGAHQKLIVVGDLHGQLNDLLWILHIHGLPSPGGAQYLFNGDFVDQGDHGAEILALLCTMKCLWPDSVHLNRGNHETMNANIAYGFAAECIHKYCNEMMQLCQWLFEALPLVHIVSSKVAAAHSVPGHPVDKIMVVHGGLPRRDKILLEDLAEVFRFQQIPTKPGTAEAELLFDLLWSDPLESRGHSSGARGQWTWQFGPDVTRTFCNENKLSMVIRSHELPESGRGYKLQHEGRMATVFSASNYCGKTGNVGAVAIITPDMSLEPIEHFAPLLTELQNDIERGVTDSVAHAENAMAKARQMHFEESLPCLRSVLMRKKKELRMWYQGTASKGSKLISREVWAKGLCEVVGMDLDWYDHQSELAEMDEDGLIDYQAFLDRYQIQVGGMLEDWAAGIKNLLIEKIVSLNLSLKDTMKLFDPDGSGFMDEEELMQVLAKIDIKPTLAQVHELTYDLEKNGKGEVDVHAFIESLQCKYEGDTADAHKGSEAMQKFGMMLHLKGDRLVTIFEKFDSSGDGKVDYDEFVGFAKELLVESGAKGSITDDELMEIARSLDSNGSGDIDFMEFVDAFAKPKEHGEKIMEHVCQSLMRYRIGLERAFFLLDMDGDGSLTTMEFQEGMVTLNMLMDGNFQLSDQDIESLVKHLDENGDGTIDFKEFCEAFQVIDMEAQRNSPTATLRQMARSRTTRRSFQSST